MAEPPPPDKSGDRRIDDPDFWQDLQSTFMTALDLLQEIADARGIQVEAPTPDALRETERKLDEQARNHPLALSAEEYARLVNHWFREAKDRIRGWSRDAARIAEMESSSRSFEEEVTSLQQAVETIASHRYDIHVKLARALRGRMRAETPVLASIADSDEDAVAAARAGIEESIEMWMRVMEFFPEEEDAILNLLIHLKGLGQEIADEFPEVSR